VWKLDADPDENEDTMRGSRSLGPLLASILCMIAVGLSALMLAQPAAAQSGGFVPGGTETPPTEVRPTDVPATDIPDVEPQPTEVPGGGIVPTEEPDSPTAEPTVVAENPTEEPDRDGVAPSTVVVILWSSDGARIPVDTTVCVHTICQSAGSLGSGTKLTFDDIAQGWQNVSVRSAAPYGDASTSVKVVPAQRSTVEVTIVREEQVVSVPPTPVRGPIRQPVLVADEGESLAFNSVNPAVPDGEGAAVAVVTALPATGAGADSGDQAALVFALGATLLLTGAAVAVRRGSRAA
jgi:hypothetical protein